MRAVLLDAYGTLVEPDWPRLNAGRDAIADRLGVPRHAAHAAWAATHRQRMRGNFGSLEGDLVAVVAAAGSSGGDRVDAALLADVAALERENWAAGVRLFPDVTPALTRLREARIPIAVVTNASAEAAGALTRLGLDQLVDHVLASCELGVLKPDLLGLALTRLRIEPADATLVDNEPGELAAARAMGLNTFLVRPGPDATRPRDTDAHGPVVSDLTEVAAVILGASVGPRR